MLNAFTYSAPRSSFGIIASDIMDDSLVDAFLTCNESDSISGKDIDGRRFRGTRKTTRFGVSMEFRRFGGRPGGDVGNRKRRNHTRHDDWMEALTFRREEERAVRQQIEEGLADYYLVAAESPRPKREKTRGNRNRRRSRNRSNNSNFVTNLTLVADVSPQPRVRNTPALTFAKPSEPARPRLTNAELRAKLGLPPKELEAVAA